jgi:hypothetical protein
LRSLNDAIENPVDGAVCWFRCTHIFRSGDLSTAHGSVQHEQGCPVLNRDRSVLLSSGYYGPGYGYGYGNGAALIGGLAAGAIVGGAIAAGQANAAAAAQQNVAYCAQRFRSYDPASGTYLGTDGYRHPCP